MKIKGLDSAMLRLCCVTIFLGHETPQFRKPTNSDIRSATTFDEPLTAPRALDGPRSHPLYEASHFNISASCCATSGPSLGAVRNRFFHSCLDALSPPCDSDAYLHPKQTLPLECRIAIQRMPVLGRLSACSEWSTAVCTIHSNPRQPSPWPRSVVSAAYCHHKIRTTTATQKPRMKIKGLDSAMLRLCCVTIFLGHETPQFRKPTNSDIRSATTFDEPLTAPRALDGPRSHPLYEASHFN